MGFLNDQLNSEFNEYLIREGIINNSEISYYLQPNPQKLVTYTIIITENFSIEQMGKLPNKFHRLMLCLLLGWKIYIYKVNNNG